jgi:hypothetical protein
LLSELIDEFTSIFQIQAHLSHSFCEIYVTRLSFSQINHFNHPFFNHSCTGHSQFGSSGFSECTSSKVTNFIADSGVLSVTFHIQSASTF